MTFSPAAVAYFAAKLQKRVLQDAGGSSWTCAPRSLSNLLTYLLTENKAYWAGVDDGLDWDYEHVNDFRIIKQLLYAGSFLFFFSF